MRVRPAAVPALLLAALLSAACSEDATGPDPEGLDLTGAWSVVQTIETDACEGETGTDSYVIELSQSGRQVTVYDEEGEAFQGTLDDHGRLRLTFSESEEGGTFSGTVELAFSSSTSFAGTYEWTFAVAGASCSGRATLQGTKTG